jgi:hypothetical protein
MIMLTKGLFSSALTWNHDISIRANVIKIIQDYIPYEFNVMSKKTHTADAKAFLSQLEKSPEATDCDIYLLTQTYRQYLKDDAGDFKKRLNFCVTKIEEQNVLLKTFGSTGQAFKTVFGI